MKSLLEFAQSYLGLPPGYYWRASSLSPWMELKVWTWNAMRLTGINGQYLRIEGRAS